jgi:WD40 repeat protein
MVRPACKTPRTLARRLLLVASACLVLGPRPAPAQNQPSPQEQELRRQLEIERAARKALTYQADMRRAAQLAEAEDWSAVATLLHQYRPAAGAADLRSWEWHFLDCLARKKELVDRQEFVVQGPSEGIHQLAWSSNGERLAAVGNDGSAVIWDLKTAKELRRLGGRVRSVSLDQTGRRITLSAENGTVTLWDTEGGPARRFFGPIQGLFNYRQPAFSPDGRRVALAVERTVAAIYDAATGRQLHRLQGHENFVSAVVWSPNSQALATGSHDGNVRLWDSASGNLTATLDSDDKVEGLQWQADGTRIAAVTARGQGTGQVRIWDVARRERVFLVEAEYGDTWRPNQPRAGLQLSADGKRVSAEAMRGATVWDTATGRPIFRGPTGASGSQLGGIDPQVRDWAFLEMLGDRATCRVVVMETALELFRVNSQIPMNNYNSALAWSPDGRRLAAGFAQGKVYVYGVPSDRAEARTWSAGPASLFEWNPDGRRFAFLVQGELRIGNLRGIEPPPRLGAPLLLPTAVSLSPDGRYLAGADRDGSLPVWDLASRQIAVRLPGHPSPLAGRLGQVEAAASALLWSPDAKRLASVRFGDGSLRIWDMKAGTLLTSLQFGGNQFEAALNDALPLVWSPDSKLLAVRSGWQQRKVYILDVTSGKRTREWDGGPGLGSSSAMAWDPTSQKIATCLGNPPQIRIWNVATGQQVLALDQPVLGLNRLTWSPDGRRLAYQVEKAQIYDFATRRTTELPGAAEQLVWNLDGSQLALVGNGSFSSRFGSRSVEFYDADTGTPNGTDARAAFPDIAAMRAVSGGVEGQNYQIKSVVWSDAGMRAAATAMAYPGMGMIVVWDIKTGKPLLTLGQIYDALTDRAKVIRMVSWSPDGRSLATLAGESNSEAQIGIWDAATGRKTQTIPAGGVNIRGAAALTWSPDGRSIAFAGQAVKVWKLAEPTQPLVLRQPVRGSHDAEQAFVAFSADCRKLAALECRHTEGREQTITAWDLATGKEQFRWSRPYELSYLHAPIAWSPDGKRIAWGGPKPAVWNVASGKEEFPLSGHSSAPGAVRWSEDSRRVLSRCEVFGPFTRTFELKVWDAATGQEVLMLRSPMAGWLVAPGFGAMASPPGQGSDPGDVVVWDLTPRK